MTRSSEVSVHLPQCSRSYDLIIGQIEYEDSAAWELKSHTITSKPI